MSKTASIYGCEKCHLCCYNSYTWEAKDLKIADLKNSPCKNYEPGENGDVVCKYRGDEIPLDAEDFSERTAEWRD